MLRSKIQIGEEEFQTYSLNKINKIKSILYLSIIYTQVDTQVDYTLPEYNLYST